MWRGSVCLLVIALGTIAAPPASASPRRIDEISEFSEFEVRPPFQHYCQGPLPWAAVLKCATLRVPSAKIWIARRTAVASAP